MPLLVFNGLAQAAVLLSVRSVFNTYVAYIKAALCDCLFRYTTHSHAEQPTICHAADPNAVSAVCCQASHVLTLASSWADIDTEPYMTSVSILTGEQPAPPASKLGAACDLKPERHLPVPPQMCWNSHHHADEKLQGKADVVAWKIHCAWCLQKHVEVWNTSVSVRLLRTCEKPPCQTCAVFIWCCRNKSWTVFHVLSFPVKNSIRSN